MRAPQRTNVVRKPHSNILVCKESDSGLYYQWGYTIRATREDVYIENSNRRYVLLPHEFDSAAYHYWVVISSYKGSPCYSLSFYKPSNDDDIIIPETSKVTIPSLDKENINVVIENANREPVYCEVYAISGVLQQRLFLGNSGRIIHVVRGLQPDNTYIVKIAVGSEVFTQRTFVQ